MHGRGKFKFAIRLGGIDQSSGSRNVVVLTFQDSARGVGRPLSWYLERFDTDGIRYALAQSLPETSDSDLADDEIVRQDFWHPLHAGPVETFEQIRPFYDLRKPGFAEAHHRVELQGKGRHKVVEGLIGLLAA